MNALRRLISPLGLLLGLGIGLAAALFWAWRVDPQILTNVNPSQLARDGKRAYVVALSLSWARDGDIIRAANRLNALDLTWTDVAVFACELARGPEAGSTGGLTAIRSMVALAETQGQRDCASQLIEVRTDTPAPTPTFITPTNTRVPPATKTITPTVERTPTLPQQLYTETAVPISVFTLDVKTFCDAEGRIEVLVQQADGSGVPGIAVSVLEDQQAETFFTGLKPQRDPGYADFTMTAERRYVVQLRDFRNARTTALTASGCANGTTERVGYRVTFRRLPGA